MLLVTNPQIALTIADADVRRLVLTRFHQICEGETWDCFRHGQLIVVEPGDTVAALEEEGGCAILENPYDGTHFGDAEFSPVFEAIEDHAGCYEIVAILNDDGFGIAIFVPKNTGVDAELLNMCARHSQVVSAAR